MRLPGSLQCAYLEEIWGKELGIITSIKEKEESQRARNKKAEKKRREASPRAL